MQMEFRAAGVSADTVPRDQLTGEGLPEYRPAATPAGRRWGHVGALAAFTAFVVFYYLDFLVGTAYLWEDLLAWYYPATNYFCVAISEGRFPFWMPGLYNGVPLYTDFQTAMFYPFQWLLALFVRDGQLPFLIYQRYIVLHLWLGGVFMFGYLKSHRLSPVACLVGSTVFCFAGFSALHIIHFPMLAVYAWLPVQLWLVDRIVATRRAKYYAGLTGVTLLSVFAGFPQQTLYSSYFVIAYWLYHAARAEFAASWRTRSKQLAGELVRITGVFLPVLLLTAVAILPTLNHWRRSSRQEMNFEAAAKLSMPWSYGLQMLVPNFAGVGSMQTNVVPFWAYEKASIPAGTIRPGAWHYWEFGAYAGQLAVIAVVAILLNYRRFRGTPVGFFLVAGVVAVWFMVGRFGGLYQVLYHVLPGISMFRTPARMASILDLCLAVSVAFFVDALASRDPPRLKSCLWVLVGAAAVGVSAYQLWGFGIVARWQGVTAANFTQQQIILAVFTLIATSGCVLALSKGRQRWVRSAGGATLATVAFIDLFCAYSFFHGGKLDPLKYLNLNAGTVAQHFAYVQEVGPTRLVQLIDGRYGQFALDSNAPLWHRGLESPRGHVDLVPRHVANLPHLTNLTALLDLQNVGHVLQTDASRQHVSFLRRSGWLPRLMFYTQTKEYQSDEHVLRDLDSGALDYRRVLAIPAGALKAPLHPIAAAAVAYSMDLGPVSPEKYRIKYSVNSPGIIFVSETYYPGWEAVDAHGRALQIVRTFTAFRGIVIPEAGTGQITVRFRPRSFRAGVAISSTTAVLLGLIYFVLIRREKSLV